MPSKEWAHLSPELRDIISAHQMEAPVKVSALARDLALPIRGATLAPGISGEIRPDTNSEAGFAIRINRHDPPRRQRFTAAHELAHYILHRDQIGRGIEDNVLYRSTLSDQREAEANRLAADILMPEALVREAIQTAQTLEIEDVVGYVADRLEVSEAAVKIRLGIT